MDEGNDFTFKTTTIETKENDVLNERLSSIEESIEDLKDGFKETMKGMFDLSNKINTLAHMSNYKFVYGEMDNPESLHVIKIEEEKNKGWKTT